VISKYAARRKNTVAAGAENIGDGMGGVMTVYPAKSWAPRGRAHEFISTRQVSFDAVMSSRQSQTDRQTERQTDRQTDRMQYIYVFTARRYAERDICYANSVCPSVRPSVCLSVTRMDCIKTAECITKILSPPDMPIILVFRHQGLLLHKSDGSWLYKNTMGSNFRPICGYISETVIDRGIVTMEDEYKVVSNSAAFDDLE